jgi:hypothetical protein
MRLILLIICLALIWKFSSTYFDRTVELISSRPPPTPMERAGAVEENMATTSQPVYRREINKALDVERQLQDAAARRKSNE